MIKKKDLLDISMYRIMTASKKPRKLKKKKVRTTPQGRETDLFLSSLSLKKGYFCQVLLATSLHSLGHFHFLYSCPLRLFPHVSRLLLKVKTLAYSLPLHQSFTATAAKVFHTGSCWNPFWDISFPCCNFFWAWYYKLLLMYISRHKHNNLFCVILILFQILWTYFPVMNITINPNLHSLCIPFNSCQRLAKFDVK